VDEKKASICEFINTVSFLWENCIELANAEKWYVPHVNGEK
jgi:hypothetical protein